MLSNYLFALKIGLGAIGAGSPVIWAITTQPYWKTVWKKEIKIKEPILTCKESILKRGSPDIKSKTNFNVILGFNGKNSKDFWEDLELQIFDVDRNRILSNKDEEGKLYDWQLLFMQGSEVSLSGGAGKNISLICNEGQPKKNIVATKDEIVRLESVGFSGTNKNCGKSFGHLECDINIASNQGLSWSPGFRPKITFSAF